ncbi:zinc finger MYM-type protein 1-like [Hydra vulgaris]|uniref:Zinc finger MYM-type protein 1-like n=1 Tax=Hydra vulgaris TaxID=6087 RepID=A0ABM4CM84_HYDVU
MLKKIKPVTSFFNILSGTNTNFDAGNSQDVSEKLVDILSDQSETSLASLSFDVSNSEVSAVLLPDTHEKDFEMNLSQESSLASNDFVLASNPQLYKAQQDITDVVIVSDDPALWPISFNERERVDIVKKGSTQVKQINFKADKSNCRFNTSFYTRVLANGEEVSRSWLVYSIQNNSVFCFCCKIFPTRKICLLSTEGYSDLKNIGSSLKQHDKSQDHISCMQKWMNMSVNLKSNATIDQNLQRMIENEKKHWRLVLERLFAIVLMLAERSLPFRGHREQLYQPNNGNFLAQVELIAKFDPVMLEHLKRIKNKECFDTYLGNNVQNEIIGLISRRILKTIVSSVQSSKYFSVIMDCTPDVSHKKQLSILLRCVKINQEEVQIEEFLCGFFHITDSTGSGLVETFLNLLAKYNLDLMSCRGQSYDNGANMRGQYKGVQALIKEKNPRALYVPCANHTFNLMVCDAAKSVSIAINFFGTVQRIFTFFAASTVRWDILHSVCKMTVKSLSDTRWESRINSIKVVKDNLVQIIEALYKVADSSSIGVAVSEANGLANEISLYQFILSLTIWHDLLFEINKVSKVMQNPSADISIMIKLVETTKIFLESFRSDESFEAIIKKSEEIAIKLGTEPVFP